MTDKSYEAMESPVQELTFEYAAFSGDERKELGLVGKNGAYTNLGLLLSDQCRHAVKVTLYGETGKTPPETRRFTGSLARQIDDVGEFLVRDDWRKLRGLLCAALIQRDYAFTGDLAVSAYPGKVTFMVMGGLPDGFSSWRCKRLYTALRRLRNFVGKPEAFTATEGAFMISYQPELPPGRKITEYLRENGSVNRKQAEAVLGLKQTAAGKVLRGLHESGLVKAWGKGKNTTYTLAD